jgi:Phage integrase, N-terminal SAM-like domain
MIEDMRVRGFTEKTRNDYVRNVRAFAAFISRSPDTATAEDLRRFQLHQTQTGMQPRSINSAVATLRFFFNVTLDRPDLARRLTIVREPRRLPAVLKRRGGHASGPGGAGGRSTRRRSPLPMAPGCACPASSRSRSATSTPSACCCGSSRAPQRKRKVFGEHCASESLRGHFQMDGFF